MPRPPRVRDPDIAFHVTNRALGRRLAFESDIDRRFFLSLLAKAVRRHFLLVLAYSLMGTHFHLFVRSRIGDLADAMQFLLGDYTRGFNAHRERQGPLWGRRYFARPVRSPRYSQCVVRYLDFNPVKANLCRTPSEYPFGSAYHYARRNGPPWLDRAWVEETVSGGPGVPYEPRLYDSVFGNGMTPAQCSLVEERLQFDGDGRDPLDELLDGGRDRILGWMLENAALADAVPPHLPVADAATVARVVRAARRAEPDWTATIGPRKTKAAWRVVVVGLLRELCSLRDVRICATLSLARVQVHRARKAHLALLARDPCYGARVAALGEAILAECHGVPS